jgi:hypothetical protein
MLKDESGEGHDGSAEDKEAEGDFAADVAVHESPERDAKAQEPDEESFPDFWAHELFLVGLERAMLFFHLIMVSRPSWTT